RGRGRRRKVTPGNVRTARNPGELHDGTPGAPADEAVLAAALRDLDDRVSSARTGPARTGTARPGVVEGTTLDHGSLRIDVDRVQVVDDRRPRRDVNPGHLLRLSCRCSR